MLRTDINIALVAMVQTPGEWPVMPDIFRNSPIVELNETHVLKKPVHVDRNLDLAINETHKLRPCLQTRFQVTLVQEYGKIMVIGRRGEMSNQVQVVLDTKYVGF